jgi:hypothetical protein
MKPTEQGQNQNQGQNQDPKRYVTIFLLTVLRAQINEFEKAGLLKRDIGNLIYETVRQTAVEEGWIPNPNPKPRE